MSRRGLTRFEKERHDQKVKADAYQLAIVVTVYVSCLYLRDNKGYGKKRLAEFVEGFAEILNDIDDGYLDFNDIIHAIYDETGIKITKGDIYERESK